MIGTFGLKDVSGAHLLVAAEGAGFVTKFPAALAILGLALDAAELGLFFGAHLALFR